MNPATPETVNIFIRLFEILNIVISVIFMVCYSYQFFYIPVSWFKKEKPRKKEVVLHRFAALISARNEEAVIADLVRSLKTQTYPAEYLSVFVLADNCTDKTAEAARKAGAIVYERENHEEVGKGYALRELRRHLNEDYPEGFDGYFIFDADNILSKNYVEEMNKTFSQGYDVLTSYRNTKNYGQNWIAAGMGLWFLRETRYLHYPRHLLGVSCTVSGTGYLFSRKIADEIVDWPYHMMTEDLEFSADMISKRHLIGMCFQAEFFDEQPVKMSESWNQRVRWGKGYIQVIRGCFGKLFRSIKYGFSAPDMILNIAPAYFLTLFSVILSIPLIIGAIVTGADLMPLVWSFVRLVVGTYLLVFLLGSITTVTEWKRIHTKTWKKILYMFTFPIFLFTFIPVVFGALLLKVRWKEIKHPMSMEKMKEAGLADDDELFK